MRQISLRTAGILAICAGLVTSQAFSAPLRVGIAGLAHGHVSGFLNGGALVPAGGLLHRTDVQLVGIAEPDRQLFDQYSARDHLAPNLYFPSIVAMIEHVHPEAVLVFTSTFGHTEAVEECAQRHVHVLMEKPLAVSYHDALLMAKAAQTGNVHVLVDYETTWYASNKAAHDLLEEGALGDVRKVVVRDGHRGPKLIHVPPEFFAWLTDPKLNGAGALYDFGCYGADLMTWIMHGEAPKTVTGVTQQLQPDVYPKVDDEANVILTYPSAVAILQGSWNWPFDIKNMVVYGRTGYAKTVLRDQIEVRKDGQHEAQTMQVARVSAPYDDPLHYLAALIKGEISENGDLSSLKTNIVVAEILDAARQSAASGKTITLPLNE
ncbi:MAG: Gfo/Idh/MocA family oxidoreductase [Acidobacteriaceae bacterium]|nr:Gfo/Idh/MocA family oxidoreductase [Acidobacteriaceae bacterium]